MWILRYFRVFRLIFFRLILRVIGKWSRKSGMNERKTFLFVVFLFFFVRFFFCVRVRPFIHLNKKRKFLCDPTSSLCVFDIDEKLHKKTFKVANKSVVVCSEAANVCVLVVFCV